MFEHGGNGGIKGLIVRNNDKTDDRRRIVQFPSQTISSKLKLPHIEIFLSYDTLYQHYYNILFMYEPEIVNSKYSQ